MTEKAPSFSSMLNALTRMNGVGRSLAVEHLSDAWGSGSFLWSSSSSPDPGLIPIITLHSRHRWSREEEKKDSASIAVLSRCVLIGCIPCLAWYSWLFSCVTWAAVWMGCCRCCALVNCCICLWSSASGWNELIEKENVELEVWAGYNVHLRQWFIIYFTLLFLNLTQVYCVILFGVWATDRGCRWS